jgi:hypothetical protein
VDIKINMKMNCEINMKWIMNFHWFCFSTQCSK